MESGAPTPRQSGPSTPRHSIHEAVIRRDARAIAHFLQKQPDCVLQQDSDGRTPLLLAAAAGDATLCTLLIRRMAALNAEAINAADVGGLAPLHWACTQQRVDAVALLLRHSASTAATLSSEHSRYPG